MHELISRELANAMGSAWSLRHATLGGLSEVIDVRVQFLHNVSVCRLGATRFGLNGPEIFGMFDG